MRDPTRIEPFMQKVANMWQQHVPDWRFGQFMSNFLGFVVAETNRDIFFVEDGEMESLMLKFFKQEDNPNECDLEVPIEQ